MGQLLEFVGNHPVLVGLFVTLLVLFLVNEGRRGGRSVSAQELVNLVNRENAVIVDLRDRKEFEAGHVVDAINIPFSTLESRSGELEKYRDRPIVAVDRMGQHAGAAGTLLRKAGFENVLRLSGGMAEWRNGNMPVVRGR